VNTTRRQTIEGVNDLIATYILDLSDALADNHLADYRCHGNRGSAAVGLEANGDDPPSRRCAVGFRDDRETKNVAADVVVDDGDGVGLIEIAGVSRTSVMIEESLRVLSHAGAMFSRNRGRRDP